MSSNLVEDETQQHSSETIEEEEEELGGLLYVCHVMFGNEELGSTVETHIRYDPAQHHPTTHPARPLRLDPSLGTCVFTGFPPVAQCART